MSILKDPEQYLPYLDEYDLTEEQKLEFLQALWTLIESFVDRAWGTDPVQQALSSKKKGP